MGCMGYRNVRIGSLVPRPCMPKLPSLAVRKRGIASNGKLGRAWVGGYKLVCLFPYSCLTYSYFTYFRPKVAFPLLLNINEKNQSGLTKTNYITGHIRYKHILWQVYLEIV